jgi:hypothetical protein
MKALILETIDHLAALKTAAEKERKIIFQNKR